MYESDQQQAVWAHPRRVCLFPAACDGNRGGYPGLPAPYPWHVDRRQPSPDTGFWVWRWRRYRHQAIERLQPFTTQPVCAWPALPAHLHGCFDLVVANHVLYYVPDLHGTLSALLRTLATPGLFLAAMAGRANAMAQCCLRCFDVIGKPYPFHTSEDCEAALAGLGAAYCTEDVHYELVFPDAEENRLRMGRFLMGDDFHAVPRQAMLQCFDPYAHAGQIRMQLVHKHFMIRRHVQGRTMA
jgi:SAM-dependent methyltransferase